MTIYKVWFRYGDETTTTDPHWVVVRAPDEEQAAKEAMSYILAIDGEHGAVIQRVEEEGKGV